MASLLMRSSRALSRVVTRHHVAQRTMVFYVGDKEMVPRTGEALEGTTAIPGIGIHKSTTGLVGLDVEPDWYNKLVEKHESLLAKMEASDMPETAQYRIDVTKWANFTLKVIRENPDDPEAVEEACRMGQVEEMIEQADDEMAVLDMYLKDRIWELVEQANPSMAFDPDPTDDPFGEGGDPDVADQVRDGVEGLEKERA